MKLYQSKVLEHIFEFKTDLTHSNLMRDHDSIYFTWKTVKYFAPKTILEIGFYKGQSLGIILEASSNSSKIVSVDINYQYLDKFNQLFPDNQIQFVHLDSRYMNFNCNFDFISIDGDHSYEGAVNDIVKCLPLLHERSILSVDDYEFFDDVSIAVKKYLLGQNNFIPFMCTPQQMFFHHANHKADDFLDEYLIKDATEFIDFTNIDFYGYTVLKGQIYNQAIAKDTSIFRSVLKFYDL